MGTVRTVLNTPFTPGSGVVPQIWVGRVEEIADAEQRLFPRRTAGLFERGRTYLGDPGLGKSVLANRLAEDRRDHGDVVADPVRLARGRDPLAALAGAVAPALSGGERLARGVARALGRVEEVGLLGSRLSVEGPTEDRYASLVALLQAVATDAANHDRLLVLRVDEVQNLTGEALSQLLTVLGDLLEASTPTRTPLGEQVQAHLPVAVLLSDLPEFSQRAADAGATFSRRFATFELEPFDDEEVRAALALAFTEGLEVLGEEGPARVGMTRDAIEEIVGRCLGDPFLFQLAGAAAWDAGTGPVVSAEEVAAGWERVRREVHTHAQGKVATLSELQLAVLSAAARLGPAAAADLADAVDRPTAASIGSTLQGLQSRRLLRRDRDGYRLTSRALARHLAGG